MEHKLGFLEFGSDQKPSCLGLRIRTATNYLAILHRASKEWGIALPSFSTAIQRMEREIGVAPFYGKAQSSVEVRLERINCDHAIPCPPAEPEKDWRDRLRVAFGSASDAFVDASLAPVIAAARLCQDELIQTTGLIQPAGDGSSRSPAP